MLQKGIVHMRKHEMQMGSMLELLVRIRTSKSLDRSAAKNRHYRSALRRQDKAFAALDKAGLSKEHRLIVDRAITATNECGTAYGEAASQYAWPLTIPLYSDLSPVS